MAERFIAIAGNIGAGKSTLVEYLTTKYPLKPIYEPLENNPYLDDFYKDMKQWSFHSQVWFLSKIPGISRSAPILAPSFKIGPSTKTQRSLRPIIIEADG